MAKTGKIKLSYINIDYTYNTRSRVAKKTDYDNNGYNAELTVTYKDGLINNISYLKKNKQNELITSNNEFLKNFKDLNNINYQKYIQNIIDMSIEKENLVLSTNNLETDKEYNSLAKIINDKTQNFDYTKYIYLKISEKKFNMAQLYFRYSTMNAGKSIEVLKIAHNYEEQGKNVLLFTSELDDRYGKGFVASRIGLKKEALTFNDKTDFKQIVQMQNKEIHCILIDEGQFLTGQHVLDLTQIVDYMNIPVIVYGLKNDSQNNLFEGSLNLLIYADKIEEVKTVCWFCNKKATMNLRIIDGKT